MIVCLDLETTGLDPKNDKIIEISMLKLDEVSLEIVEEFHSLVHPGKEIPKLIQNITTISNEMVEEAPKFSEIKKQVVDFLGNSIILGQNITFDIDFLEAENIPARENGKIDTFFLANFLCYDAPSLNLEMLSKRFEIELSGAHRAFNDTRATVSLFRALLEEFGSLGSEERELFSYVFQKSSDKNINYIYNLLYGNSIKDIEFHTFSKKMLKIIGTEKKIEPNIMIADKELDNVDISELFSDISGLKKRENQLKMAEKVFSVFDKHQKILIEAPTGLGKSFAYLIPAVMASQKFGKKVYVSTKTKTLQDQLYKKDLSFLQEQLGIPFSYTKIKGKNNYFSIKEFFDYLELGNFTYDEVCLFLKIIHWLTRTEYGEVEEIRLYPFEYHLFGQFRASAFHVGEKNEYKEYEFLHKARKRVHSADIVIINHSLLFSNLESEAGVLPDMDTLIIDEAHSLEDAVTDALRKRIQLDSLKEVFEKVQKVFRIKNIEKIEFENKKEQLLSKLYTLFEFGEEYIFKKELYSEHFKTVLIEADFYEELDFQDILKKTYSDFLEIIDILNTKKEYDFANECLFLSQFSETLLTIFSENKNENLVKIVNYSEKKGISFDYTLLNTAKYLEKDLWEQLESVVLTSATLQVRESFDYFSYTLGLQNFEKIAYESDFNYEKQATLFIPNDLGDIKKNSEAVISFLEEFYTAVGGNTLTLLTSFSMIKKIYMQLNMNVKQSGTQLLAQSIGGSKMKLLSQYLESPQNSILLGTDSFWEGVDIPGDDLKYLIIHKFPFQVPSDPLFQARSSLYKNAFSEYAIPKSIIKLKQGFGRLIRSENDKGVVVLLDNRIYSTAWGADFYTAFPKNINKKICSSGSLISLFKLS